MYKSLDQAIQAIVSVGRRLDSRGLAAATSGNYSVRLAQGPIAITVSGRHKGRLGAEDVMLVDAEGIALDDRRPSAETALHTSLYQLYPHVNAVLHVHSVAAVTLTRYLPGAGEIVLEGYEMMKAFPGISTHETTVSIPVHDNSQDIQTLAGQVASRLREGPLADSRACAAATTARGSEQKSRLLLAATEPQSALSITRRPQASFSNEQVPAYLIRGHGTYAWGKDLDEAERIIEALEHLLMCEIEALRLRAGRPI
jgi:methylthioribulose-1-phosphate dehydratase